MSIFWAFIAHSEMDMADSEKIPAALKVGDRFGDCTVRGLIGSGSTRLCHFIFRKVRFEPIFMRAA